MSSRRDNWENAFKITFNSPKRILIGVFVFILSLILYAYAISETGTFETFFKESPILIVILQIVFGILNSILISIATVEFIHIFTTEHKQSGVSIFGVVSALFFSVASTGCYVCGTVLFPVLGVAASFASLPLGGLEVKILTAFMLLYSVNDLSQKVLGICYYDKNKIYKFQLGTGSLNISAVTVNNIKPIFITGGFIILIVLLPYIVPEGLRTDFSADNVCDHSFIPQEE